MSCNNTVNSIVSEVQRQYDADDEDMQVVFDFGLSSRTGCEPVRMRVLVRGLITEEQRGWSTTDCIHLLAAELRMRE